MVVVHPGAAERSEAKLKSEDELPPRKSSKQISEPYKGGLNRRVESSRFSRTAGGNCQSGTWGYACYLLVIRCFWEEASRVHNVTTMQASRKFEFSRKMTYRPQAEIHYETRSFLRNYLASGAPQSKMTAIRINF